MMHAVKVTTFQWWKTVALSPLPGVLLPEATSKGTRSLLRARTNARHAVCLWKATWACVDRPSACTVFFKKSRPELTSQNKPGVLALAKRNSRASSGWIWRGQVALLETIRFQQERIDKLEDWLKILKRGKKEEVIKVQKITFCLYVLAWTFLFLCSFLNNYPWTYESNSIFNKVHVQA